MQEIVRQHHDQHSEMELAAMLGIGRKALWVRRRHWGLYRSGNGYRTSQGGSNTR